VRNQANQRISENMPWCTFTHVCARGWWVFARLGELPHSRLLTYMVIPVHAEPHLAHTRVVFCAWLLRLGSFTLAPCRLCFVRAGKVYPVNWLSMTVTLHARARRPYCVDLTLVRRPSYADGRPTAVVCLSFHALTNSRGDMMSCHVQCSYSAAIVQTGAPTCPQHTLHSNALR